MCQLLKAICSIEDLQRPLRKNEKKPLNGAQKAIKYHLEGNPSQVRVKENWEKAFVLLQTHIAGLQLDCGNPTLEFTLRNEAASMVDYASRMLAAIEEYSCRGSKNGHVLFQSLRLRRAMALHMWGPQDGVLKQIKGISNDLVGRLRLHGITGFHDVLVKSTEEIEKSASRDPPFGMDLQSACRSLVDSALKIEATVYTAQGSRTPSNVVCKLIPRNADRRENWRISDVHYSLLVFTDQPGGCLLLTDNITEAGEYQVMVPPMYGKISVRLVASVVGFDGTK
jgi:Sec63 Brl domain